MRHFLQIDDFDANALHARLALAQSFLSNDDVPQIQGDNRLVGKVIINAFFENSTRTRTTFELAARHLGAMVVNLDIARSSTAKGETLADTVQNLEAMGAHALVVRHHVSGAPHFIAKCCPHISIVNAGDGQHAHPTQAMLDMLTILRHSNKDFADLKVAIVGDIKHSRVARSDTSALLALGCGDIRLIAPPTLMAKGLANDKVRAFYDLSGIDGVDIVIALRVQNERIDSPVLAGSAAYYRDFGLSLAQIKQRAPDAWVMHPGPINRGVEIQSALADDERALILRQVRYGVASRMAVLAHCLGAV